MSAAKSLPGLQELRALANLINHSIDELEQVCVSQGKDIPSLSEPADRQAEAMLFSPEAIKAGSLITAAAAQLAAAARPSLFTTVQTSFSYFIPAAIGIAIKAHTPEILREAGSKGLHVKDIAAYTSINAEKLAHVLRLLATSHIFKEVAPDTFANNRISATLDTGKSVKEIISDPQAKYDGTQSATAMIERITTSSLLNAAYFSDVIFDPKLTHSGEPNETAFNLAQKTNLPFFEWLNLPEQAQDSKLFAIGMGASEKMSGHSIIAKGFDWKSLPKGSIVVDVGGNNGSQTAALAKEFDHLQYVVQDRAPVIENDAPKFWDAAVPGAVASGRVKLQVHDMFAPQPIRNAAVFFLRAMTHDWSDDYCVKFLSQLRAAATPQTQLIVIDNVMPYACRGAEQTLSIPGADKVRPIAPEPLLPNFGVAGLMTYLADLAMLAGLNGHERTIPEFAKLFERSGWKLVRVHESEGFSFHDIKLVGVPA